MSIVDSYLRRPVWKEKRLGRQSGYQAQWSQIRRTAEQTREEAEHISRVRDELRDVFAVEGRPMGHDQYGAEFEKSFPQRTKGVFDAFDAYLDELEGTSEGLHVTANTYEIAEHHHEG
jgi:hypothetical protein